MATVRAFEGAFQKDNEWYVRRDDGTLRYLGAYVEDRLSDEQWHAAMQVLKQKNLPFNNTPPSGPIDHRSYHQEVRKQDSRNTCACFALVAAMEGVLARRGIWMALSEQFANYVFMRRTNSAYFCSSGVALEDGAEVLKSEGICSLSECPYLDSSQIGGIDCRPSIQAHNNAVYRISRTTLIPGPRFGETKLTTFDLPQLKQYLAEGHDIAVATTQRFTPFLRAYRKPVHDLSDTEEMHPWNADELLRLGHAMLIVGYENVDGIPCFICRDSSNYNRSEAAEDGYIYVSERLLAASTRYGIVVNAVAIGTQEIFEPRDTLLSR